MEVCFISIEGPKKSDEWDDFMEDEEDAWYEAFETIETEDGIKIDMDAYDEFDNIQELVNFVAGQGSYSDRRSFSPGHEDMIDQKREMNNDVWKIPEKVGEINRYLAQGARRGEIDIDPRAVAKWEVTESEAKPRGKDKKYTAHFAVYDPDEGTSDSYTFYISTSWYDQPPEELNAEEVFDLEGISERLDKRFDEEDS